MSTEQKAFNAAINFAIDDADGEGITFLRLWRNGDWESIENEFPRFVISNTLKRPQQANHQVILAPTRIGISEISTWNPNEEN